MSTTLAQAITDLGLKAGIFERPAGPVLDPLLTAVEVVVSARARLDGLEEAKAFAEARAHAFERAVELVERVEPFDTRTERTAFTIELANFLAPGYEELDGVRAPGPDDDPFGPTESVSELEAKLTEAEETVLAQRDRIADLITERDDAVDGLELVRSDSTVLTLWGEELGRMTKADAERASIVIQRELSSRSAVAQRVEEKLASAEAQRVALEATVANYPGVVHQLEGELEDLRAAHASALADRERALELIRGHVFDIEAARKRVTELEEELAEVRVARDSAVSDAETWRGRASTLNPLFGGPHINDELEDLDTLNAAGVGLHGDRISFMLWNVPELELEPALVVAATIVAVAQAIPGSEGLFAAVYRRVCNA